MSVPGLCTEGMRWAFAALMFVGYVILIVGTAKNGGSKPASALTLLIASNASFWLSFGLWLIRLRLLGYSPPSGIDVYAGPVALWVILLLPFVVYEAVVFVWGIAVNRQRGIAVIGMLAVIVQVLVTLRTAYGMVQGV